MHIITNLQKSQGKHFFLKANRGEKKTSPKKEWQTTGKLVTETTKVEKQSIFKLLKGNTSVNLDFYTKQEYLSRMWNKVIPDERKHRYHLQTYSKGAFKEEKTIPEKKTEAQ